ncbi:MAG: plastocyanin/azurin family copper-binding protein [Candidatus Bipolaricaulia bacterium]
MERWLAILAALVAALIGVLFFWLGGPTRTEIAQRVFVVEVRDHYFDPPGLVVQPNDRVVWVLKENAQGDGHTVTAYHPSQDRPLRIPAGARPWNSGLMTQIGQSYSYIFSLPGVYDYFCALHEQQGMVGRVIVGGTASPSAMEQGLPAAAQSALPTIEELAGVVGEAFNALALLQGIEYLVGQSQTVLALRQLKEFQGVFSQSALAEALTKQGAREQFENRLSVLEALLSRGAPISAVAQTVAQAKALLDALTRL